MEFFRNAKNYRIWIDENGIGYIRILKRVGFKIVVSLFEEVYREIKKRTDNGKVHIVFYISRSLHDNMAANAKEFIQFCQTCMNIEFELILMELDRLNGK